jgi:hypothetical protein
MNMVSILAVPLALQFDSETVNRVKEGAAKFHFPLPEKFAVSPINTFWMVTVAVCLALLIWAIRQSHREKA